MKWDSGAVINFNYGVGVFPVLPCCCFISAARPLDRQVDVCSKPQASAASSFPQYCVLGELT